MKRPFEDGSEERPSKQARTSSSQSSVSRYAAYRRGSIVRVTLHNFMSYSDAQFEPGPLLNVILGPNGTGKSSIVCAIALGLCGATSVLGRAKDPREFIKLGTDEGSVEIELARVSTNGKNLIIKRTFKPDNTSVWKLNGKGASKAEVQAKIGQLNIQVDNVCQFLAQEKVVKFAELNEYDLLKETEKAAGHKDMLPMHEKLIELKTAYNNRHLKFTQERWYVLLGDEHLADLKAQNDKVKRDVLRFRQREETLAKVQILKLKKPLVIYNSHMEDETKLRGIMKTAKANLSEYQKKLEPVQTKINAFEEEVMVIEESKKTVTVKLKKLDQLRTQAARQIANCEERYEAKKSELDGLKDRAGERQTLAMKLEAKVGLLEQQLADIPEDDGVLREELAVKMQALDEQVVDVKSKMGNHQQQHSSAHYELRQINNELKELSNGQQQALARLKQMRKPVYNARSWINNNKERFRKPIYGPVMLEVTVGDQYHRDCLDMQTADWVAFGFVVMCPEDGNLLTEELLGKQKLKVAVMDVSRVDRSASQHPNVRPETLNKYKLTWLSDVAEAPEPVRQALAANCGLFAPVVGDRSLIPNLQNCMQELGTVPLYTPESKYSSFRSNYGNKGVSTSVMPIRPAKKYTGIDTSRKQELEDKARTLRSQLDDAEQTKEKMQARLREILREQSDLKRQRDAIVLSKRHRVETTRKIASTKEALENLQQEEDTASEEQSIKAEMERLLLKRVALIQKLVKIHQQLAKYAMESDTSQLRKTEIQAKVTELKIEHQTLVQAAESLNRTLEAAERDYQDARRVGKEKKAEADRAMSKVSPEDKAKFDELPEDLAALNLQITENQAIADANYRSNPQVITDFNNRLVEIEALEAKLASSGEAMSNKGAEIEQLREKWLPPLQELVSKIDAQFRHYFQRIGCTGAVMLAQHENYENFGLQLKVSFRSAQDAQVLDSSTQSGGERSVTTMLYLLSLQDLTPCPFRLVDEINQGMDPTNERMIFDEVAAGACRPGHPQFFMVTPKLLPGLKFTKDMTVFFIMNGPWNMPQAEWDSLEF